MLDMSVDTQNTYLESKQIQIQIIVNLTYNFICNKIKIKLNVKQSSWSWDVWTLVSLEKVKPKNNEERRNMV